MLAHVKSVATWSALAYPAREQVHLVGGAYASAPACQRGPAEKLDENAFLLA